MAGVAHGVARWRIPGWATAAAALLVIAALLWFGNVGAVFADLGTLSLPHLALALALVTAGYTLRFGKWHLLARMAGLRLRLARSVQVFLGGLMMVVTPAKLGDLWKTVLLTQDGIAVARSLPPVALERVLDFAAVCLLGGLGFAWMTGQLWLLALVVAGFGVLFVALHSDRAWGWMERLLGRWKRTAPAARFVSEVQDGARPLLRLRVLLPAYGLALGAWALEGLALGVLVAGLGGHVAPVSALAAFCVGTIAGVASLLPGGLGPTEAGMVALLVAAGASSRVAEE